MNRTERRSVGIRRTPNAAHQWSIADEQWFSAHADRRHYLRTPFAGELENLNMPQLVQSLRSHGDTIHILVLQIEERARVRTPCVVKTNGNLVVCDHPGSTDVAERDENDAVGELLKLVPKPPRASCSICRREYRHEEKFLHILLPSQRHTFTTCAECEGRLPTTRVVVGSEVHQS